MSRFHAILQRIVADYLSSLGYDVQLEHAVDEVHVADVYGVSDGGSVIVEVETGYVPPMFLAEAEDYLVAKFLSKALKYSPLADEFFLAMPSYIRPPLSEYLASPGGPVPERAADLLRKFFGDKALLLLDKVGKPRVAGLMFVNIAERKIDVERP